jgi:DNA-binding MarR family transcriptional regulator
MAAVMSLTPAEARAAMARRTWARFHRAHELVAGSIDSHLVERCGLSLTQFDVLDSVVDGPLRMNEVADRALLSPSGLTRVVDALATNAPTQRVRRTRTDEDRRGVLLEITPAGAEQHARARLVLDELLAEDFTGRLRASHLLALDEITGLLADRGDR